MDSIPFLECIYTSSCNLDVFTTFKFAGHTSQMRRSSRLQNLSRPKNTVVETVDLVDTSDQESSMEGISQGKIVIMNTFTIKIIEHVNLNLLHYTKYENSNARRMFRRANNKYKTTAGRPSFTDEEDEPETELDEQVKKNNKLLN